MLMCLQCSDQLSCSSISQKASQKLEHGLSDSPLRPRRTIKQLLMVPPFGLAECHTLPSLLEYPQVRFHEGVFMEKNVESFRSGKPVLICGDFNAEPTEDVVKYYQASALELQSAYTQLSESGCENPAYTTWKIRGSKTPGGKEKEACHTIDYMWYQPKHMGVTSLLSIPTGDEIGPNRLPSWHYPSDHFSLAADFIFNQG